MIILAIIDNATYPGALLIGLIILNRLVRLR